MSSWSKEFRDSVLMDYTAYTCPLCSEIVHREPAAWRQRKEPNGDVVFETLYGRSTRIERVIEVHMLEVHDLTPEQAVEKLRAVQNQEGEPR